jgi:hypothetical protein
MFKRSRELPRKTPAFWPRHLLAMVDDGKIAHFAQAPRQDLQACIVLVEKIRHDLLRRQQIHQVADLGKLGAKDVEPAPGVTPAHQTLAMFADDW